MNDNKHPENSYDPISNIPTYFWHSKTYHAIPTYSHSRKALCQEIFDFKHFDICTNKTFHVKADEAYCRCSVCGKAAARYHQYNCDLM